MKIKANFSELTNVSGKMQTNSYNLENEIDKALKCIESLKNIWQGDDADTFYDNATAYFTQMKVLPATMKIVGNFVENSSNKYKDNDEGFKKELDKEKDLLQEQQTLSQEYVSQTFGSEML